jgi:TrmH family RNA methyltransferase
VISKRSDPLVRHLREVRSGGLPLLFIEGVRLAEELLASTLPPLEFYFTDGLKKSKALLPNLEKKGAKGHPMTEDVMSFVSDMETAPGLIVVAKRPASSRWEDSLRNNERPLAVVLDGAQTPANAGAVVRAAEAAGARAVLQSKGGADLLGPKALRAAAGSAFRLPVEGGKTAGDWAQTLSNMGLRCVTADAKGETEYTDFDWTGPTALFLGGEAGVSDEKLRGMPKVRIPLRKPVESLNVAVAAGVLLFEAARQRALP